MTSDATSDHLAQVLRWESSGGEVEILDLGPPLVLALCTCDGGQEMQRIVSWAQDLRDHLNE